MKKLLIYGFCLILTSCANSVKSCDIDKVLEQVDVPTKLSESLSIDQIEAKELVTIRPEGEEEQEVIFGYLNKDWGKFKSQYKNGDCIYEYTYEESVKPDGYILVRGSEIVAVIIKRFK